MSGQSRRDMLISAARWVLAGGSVAGAVALSARRGDACRLPLACADCALASQCSLPKRRDSAVTTNGRRPSMREASHER